MKKVIANVTKIETPTWAKITFRIFFTITTALAFFMAGTKIIPEEMKFEVLLGLKSFDFVLYGVSKMFGVEKEEN